MTSLPTSAASADRDDPSALVRFLPLIKSMTFYSLLLFYCRNFLSLFYDLTVRSKKAFCQEAPVRTTSVFDMIHQTLVVKRRVGDAESGMYAGRGSYFTLFSGILTAFRLYRLGNLCTVQCALAAGNIDYKGSWNSEILGISVKYSRKRAAHTSRPLTS